MDDFKYSTWAWDYWSSVRNTCRTQEEGVTTLTLTELRKVWNPH